MRTVRWKKRSRRDAGDVIGRRRWAVVHHICRHPLKLDMPIYLGKAGKLQTKHVENSKSWERNLPTSVKVTRLAGLWHKGLTTASRKHERLRNFHRPNPEQKWLHPTCGQDEHRVRRTGQATGRAAANSVSAAQQTDQQVKPHWDGTITR